MDIRHNSRARPVGEERSVEEMAGAPSLTEDDQHALEAIRRRLDSEFPASSRKGGSAGRTSWHAAGTEGAEQKGEPWKRVRRAWIVVGMLLLTCVLGGVAGALATILYLKNAAPPVVADRERPRPSPEPVESPSTAEAPTPPLPTTRATKGFMGGGVSPGRAGPSASPIAPPTAVQATAVQATAVQATAVQAP